MPPLSLLGSYFPPSIVLNGWVFFLLPQPPPPPPHVQQAIPHAFYNSPVWPQMPPAPSLSLFIHLSLSPPRLPEPLQWSSPPPLRGDQRQTPRWEIQPGPSLPIKRWGEKMINKTLVQPSQLPSRIHLPSWTGSGMKPTGGLAYPIQVHGHLPHGCSRPLSDKGNRITRAGSVFPRVEWAPEPSCTFSCGLMQFRTKHQPAKP